MTSSILKVSCPEKVTSATIDGKKVKTTKNSISFKGIKDGKHKVIIKTKNFTSTYTVAKDTTKPSISGVKNGKIYNGKVTITVKDNVKISWSNIEIDGHCAFDTTFTVDEPGEHTVTATDEVGNVNTVTFTIK